VKSKALVNLEAMPILFPDDMMKLERREQVMLEVMQSSLNPDTWMDTA